MMAPEKNLRGRPRTKPVPEFDRLVGGRIKQRRELANMSSEKLADRTGYSVHQIGRFESGNTSVKPEALARIAGALGCTAAAFVDGIKVKK